MGLLDIVRNRTIEATGLTKSELKSLMYADESVLHNPYLYDGMSTLVEKLHDVSLDQKENPKHLLVIDTDYDTDGVMSAAVLSAALDVFNINFRVYIPSMSDGYGLNPKAVREMKSMYETNGYMITTILTADNGTNANAGVDEANQLGITVLVTDHHLGGDDYAKAEVIVNPNKKLANGDVEPYPFKGNAGATVAWKAMLAYAQRYEKDKLPLIKDLIVFAGIANVSDVMPILDENHYMVKQAVNEIRRLIHIQSLHEKSVFSETSPYIDIKNTPYVHYNTVFHGLYDMLFLLQESKDEKRISQGKKPNKLNNDEELIGWYLSPMINAPRRIHATSREAMMAFMATMSNVREDNIKSMIAMNELKSEIRNGVTSELDWDIIESKYGNVVFVNAQHGISGLIAGQITSRTGKASIVFALPTKSDKKVYGNHDFDERFDADALVIGGSARSTSAQPLNVIMARIAEIRPDIIVGGGGHAAAAGYSIKYKYLDVFTTLFNSVAKAIEEEIITEYNKLIESGAVEPVVKNEVLLSVYDGNDSPDHAHYNILSDTTGFSLELMQIHSFQTELKPFGKDFNAQTTFIMDINPMMLLDNEYNLNLNFWKTLKFNLYGVDVLTFDIDLADLIKSRINDKNPAIIRVKAKLEMNSFRGNVTPQLQLSA